MKFVLPIIATIITLMIIGIIIFTIIKLEKLYSNDKVKQISAKNIKNTIYSKKQYLTQNEKVFLRELLNLISNDYIIITQIPLVSIVQKQGNFKYQNELFRIIDFAIFDKSLDYPKLLIELNDKSHNEQDRIERDEKVKEICNKANIKLIAITAGGNYRQKITSEIPKEFLQKTA